MATTPNLAFPYPVLTDSPNVPRDIKALAEDVDAKMQFRPVYSTDDVANPYDGQIVYNLTDNICYIYNASASAWWKLSAFARYELQSGTTQLAANTVSLLQFPTAVESDPRVVPAGGGNTSFSVAPGRWTITASVRLLFAGNATLFIGTGTTANEANALAGDTCPSNAFNASVSTTVEFSTTTSVCVFTWSEILNYSSAGGDGNPFPHMTSVTFSRGL